MFSYQPNQSRAGEYYRDGLIAQGQYAAQADLDMAQRRHNAIVDGAGMVGDAAKTAAGFAMGGPAGAAMASGMGGGGGGGGGLLDTIIGAYAQKEQDKSDSKIYGNLMKVVAPAFGEDGDAIMEQWKSLESDRDKARFGSTLFSSLGQISNMYMAQGRMEQAPALQAQRVTDQRDIMYERERLQREREVMNTPQGPAPVTVPTAMRRFNKPI
jgi:hypothetical protein